MKEPNESKVANLLAAIDELVDHHGQIAVLVECIEELQKQIEQQDEIQKHTVNILEDVKDIVKAHQDRIEEMEKALTKLRERFEEHEDFKPELAHGEDED